MSDNMVERLLCGSSFSVFGNRWSGEVDLKIIYKIHYPGASTDIRTKEYLTSATISCLNYAMVYTFWLDIMSPLHTNKEHGKMAFKLCKARLSADHHFSNVFFGTLMQRWWCSHRICKPSVYKHLCIKCVIRNNWKKCCPAHPCPALWFVKLKIEE